MSFKSSSGITYFFQTGIFVIDLDNDNGFKFLSIIEAKIFTWTR